MGHDQKVERQKNEKLKTSSEQEKKSQTNKVSHRNKWWLIETTSNEEGGEYGEDYQVPAPCGKFLTILQNAHEGGERGG